MVSTVRTPPEESAEGGDPRFLPNGALGAARGQRVPLTDVEAGAKPEVAEINAAIAAIRVDDGSVRTVMAADANGAPGDARLLRAVTVGAATRCARVAGRGAALFLLI